MVRRRSVSATSDHVSDKPMHYVMTCHACGHREDQSQIHAVWKCPSCQWVYAVERLHYGPDPRFHGTNGARVPKGWDAGA